MADIFALLVRNPFDGGCGLSLDEVRRATPRQLYGVYLRPKPADPKENDGGIPDPQTDDEFREWCRVNGSLLGVPAGDIEAWIERALPVWRQDRENAASAASADGGQPL